MKIVHVITRFMRGGADENTLLSCNAQVELGHEVHLIFGKEHSDPMLAKLDARVRQWAVEDLVRPVNPVKDAAALVHLVKIYRKIQPDIVHTHTSKAGILGRFAAIFSGVRGVVHGVHILPFVNVGRAESFVYLALEKMVAPSTRAFVNVSEGMRELGLRFQVGREERHFVIPSGMDVTAFRSASAFSSDELRERSGAAEGAPLLVLVAALERRKRQFEFLDVLVDVRKAVPDVQLVLLGEGTDEARLRERVDQLGLDRNVVFLGFSDEVERWIASATVCVFASEREGLPRAVIQYAMVGTPVVSTSLPGIERVVIDGATGFLVDLDDLSAMVRPIIQLLRDPDLASNARKASREIDLSPWEVKNMVDKLEDVYLSVV